MKKGSDQLDCLALLTGEQLDAAVAASTTSLQKHLRQLQQQLQEVNQAREKLKDQLNKEAGKYQLRKMEVGSIGDFHEGLTDRIGKFFKCSPAAELICCILTDVAGSPNLDFEKSMRAEHCSMDGHSFEFTTPNYKVTTTPFKEWLYIAGDEKGQCFPCPDMGHERCIVSIEVLLETLLAKRAKLTRAEIIAVVLYTGPMYVVYNGILRRYPKELYDVFAKSDNRFSTTIFVLVSAVQKLTRCVNIPDGTLLYRGLGGSVELPDSFANADENGCKGYTEPGFMSTTADRNVAVQYSGVKDKKPQASIMEIHPNSIDRGADISEFSQYPGEKEFLFVPMSFVQGDGRCRLEVGPGGGVLKVISVRININIKTETVDQLRQKKKSMHVSAFKSVIDETKRWMRAYAEDNRGLVQARAATDREYRDSGSDNERRDIPYLINSTIEQLTRIQTQDSQLPHHDYVDDLTYKALVSRMLSSQAWAKQKLLLWLENQETTISGVVRKSLKDAHREWLSFLKLRKYSIAFVGSDERKSAAVKILQCKGLIVSDNASTEMADEEPVVYAAVADSWALEDLRVCVACKPSVAFACIDSFHSSCSMLEQTLEQLTGDRDVDSDACLEPMFLYSQGQTPLHAASRNGDKIAFEEILSFGADLSHVDK